MAADVTGKWTYQQPAAGVAIQSCHDHSEAGRHNSHRYSSRLRPWGQAPPSEITNGKVDGDNIYFEVKRQTQNGESVSKYEGTVSGDT